jgi:hypothetical protein
MPDFTPLAGPDGTLQPAETDSLGRRAEAIGRMLAEQMLDECGVMAHHALSNGAPVPPALLGRLADYLEGRPGGGGAGAGAQAGDAGTTASIGQELVEIHEALARAVAPARPATLKLFAAERRLHPRLIALGPVKVVRHFLMLGLASLIAMLGLALSPEVNTETLKRTLLELSGMQLLVVELFLLTAASLGSCFANLQKLNGYISAGTYDPKFESTYWMRWAMGVISGIVLSQILYGALVAKSMPPDAANFGEPALALFGGYSAQLVHRILARVLQSIETLFGADPPAAGK